MTEPIVNVPLLRKAVEWAEAEAAKPYDECRWYQGSWLTETDCGTSYCIAGYVAQLLDARYASDETVDGVSSAGLAAVALGLVGDEQKTEWQSVAHIPLFASSNSIEDVRRIAEDIAGERL